MPGKQSQPKSRAVNVYSHRLRENVTKDVTDGEENGSRVKCHAHGEETGSPVYDLR